ncbi:hypothetical protein TNCV_1712081 [Trichonephila clavipes]|nr:hypothetical protein TNCV_1712081 [Trichonephila clavipes]
MLKCLCSTSESWSVCQALFHCVGRLGLRLFFKLLPPVCPSRMPLCVRSSPLYLASTGCSPNVALLHFSLHFGNKGPHWHPSHLILVRLSRLKVLTLASSRTSEIGVLSSLDRNLNEVFRVNYQCKVLKRTALAMNELGCIRICV